MKQLTLWVLLGLFASNAWAWREPRVNPGDDNSRQGDLRPAPPVGGGSNSGGYRPQHEDDYRDNERDYNRGNRSGDRRDDRRNDRRDDRPIIPPPNRDNRPPNRPNPPAYGHQNRSRNNYDNFRDFQGKKFVPVKQICNVQDIKVQVLGGDVTINELTLLLGNSMERVNARLTLRDGQESQWIRLYNRNNCLQGFFIDAYNHPDWDRDDTLIVLWGTTPDGRSYYELQGFELGYVYLKDYNERRNYRRGPGNGPIRPEPGYPTPGPGAPSFQWFDLGTVRAQKGLRTVHTFPANHQRATEVIATALHADINITQAFAIDQFGQPISIPGLIGPAPRNFQKGARLSPYGALALQAIRVEIVSDNLIGSRGELNLRLGVTR